MSAGELAHCRTLRTLDNRRVLPSAGCSAIRGDYGLIEEIYMTHRDNSNHTPFLKWAGGKALARRVPSQHFPPVFGQVHRALSGRRFGVFPPHP